MYRSTTALKLIINIGSSPPPENYPKFPFIKCRIHYYTHYGMLIVGAGIAGSALAHALSTLPRSKLLNYDL